MKLVPWLLTVVLLLLARAFATSLPSSRNALSSKPGYQVAQTRQNDSTSEPEGNLATRYSPSIEQQNDSATQTGGSCESAGSAVVTIHAGRSFGSGSIVSSDGLVITNNHVVRPSMDGQVGVRTIGGSRYRGSVIGIDPVNDLALIKLSTQERLPVIRIGSRDSVQQGEKVCAIGSPYGHPGVLTKGTLTTFRNNGDIQSALLLEPGNSGGPLLNQQGEMIGVNKAIWQSRDGQNSGISFATNIAAAKDFIEKNRSNTGTIASRPGFGYPGVDVMPPQQEEPPAAPYSPFSSVPSRGMEQFQPPLPPDAPFFWLWFWRTSRCPSYAAIGSPLGHRT